MTTDHYTGVMDHNWKSASIKTRAYLGRSSGFHRPITIAIQMGVPEYLVHMVCAGLYQSGTIRRRFVDGPNGMPKAEFAF